MSEPNGWHLDKKVPVSIIGVLVAQLAVGAWMLAGAYGQTESNKNVNNTQQEQINTLREDMNSIKSDVRVSKNDTNYIKRAIEKLIEKEGIIVIPNEDPR